MIFRRWLAGGLAVIALGASLDVSRARAWNLDEHRHLVRVAFTTVRDELGRAPDLEEELVALCVETSGDDLSAPRQQRRGWTPYQQAAWWSSAALAKARREAPARPLEAWVGDLRDDAIARYLALHLIALDRAARGPGGMADALRWEAIALGPLADAFSAGHLRLPAHGWLASRQRTNLRLAHDRMSQDGLYVVNGHHDAWQAYGDGSLQWYEPSYRRVREAVVESVREVYLVALVAGLEGDPAPSFVAWADAQRAGGDWSSVSSRWRHDGDGSWFYEDARLPALRRIPMPVTATWSVRDGALRPDAVLHSDVERGATRHFPQLVDASSHDPDDADLSPELLYEAAALPPSLRLSLPAPPATVIRDSVRIASVHYVQRTGWPPALGGLALTASSGLWLGDRSGDHASLGVAGFKELVVPVVEAVHVGLDLEWFWRFGDAGRQAFAPTVRAGLGLPLPLVSDLEAELGAVLEPDDEVVGNDVLYGLRLSAGPLSLPGTYAGVCVGIAWRVFGSDDRLHTVELQLRIQ